MIYYLDTRFNVPHEIGKPIPLNKAANREKYGPGPLYWLGEVDGKQAYSDTLGEQLPVDPVVRWGVNLSGGEFRTAIMPSEADIDWYAQVGFTLIRFPWSDKVLADPKMIARIAALDAHAKSLGLERIHDRHSYKYATAGDALAFLSPLFRALPDDAMVELANEPVNGYPAGANKFDAFAKELQPTIDAIRNAGFRHRILIGWPGWNSMFRVNKKEGTKKASESLFTAIDRAGGFRDPLGLTFLSPHRYFNDGGSGVNATCTKRSAEISGVIGFANEIRSRGLKAYITEVAFGNHARIHSSCGAVGPNFISDVHANADVILGVAWWGAGRAWKEDYHFKIEPKKGTRATVPLSEYTKLLLG